MDIANFYTEDEQNVANNIVLASKNNYCPKVLFNHFMESLKFHKRHEFR